MRTLAFLIALLPAVAFAQEEVSGTLRDAPLHIESTLHVWPIVNQSPLVDRVRAVAGEKRQVRATVRKGEVGFELLSIHGALRADAKLLGGLGPGATALKKIPAGSDVLLTGAYGDFFQASFGGTSGWLPVEFVDVGQQSVTGGFIGKALAPLFGFGAKLRQSRFFHPAGRTYTGTARSIATGEFAEQGKRLEGAVLARLGGGLLKFKHDDVEYDLPDVPGMAFRFTAPGAPTTDDRPGDQDLLFTAYTERFRTLVTGISFLKADAHDFMNNEYFTDVPARIAGEGDFWVRTVPHKCATHGATRAEKFDNCVKEGHAVFTLEIQHVNESWTREWLGVDVGKLVTTRSLSAARAENPWIPLVEIRFEKSVDLDQGKLHFHPDLNGRGLTPMGVVAAIRRPVYKASQANRPESEGIIKKVGVEAPAPTR